MLNSFFSSSNIYVFSDFSPSFLLPPSLFPSPPPCHVYIHTYNHRPDSMLVLEVNSIVGFVANYLCLVLGYLVKFLYYKTLTGWPWENLLKKNYSHVQVIVILLDGILSLGQLIMPALTLAINLSFFLLLKLNQSNKKSFSKGGKISHNYGMDLYR